MFKTTSGNGFHITLANGCTVSVQWGLTSYCEGRDLRAPYEKDLPARECATAEVAAWRANGKWINLSEGNDVIGWQTPNQVLAIMTMVATLPKL